MDTQNMDKEMLLAYRERWRLVNEFELEEKRQTSVLQRWRKLNSIIHMAVELGIWRTKNEVEISLVRERWNYLREIYLAEQKE